MKVASFHVRGTAEQAARWNRAAEAEGHRSAGTWLAAAADAYLKVRAKAGLPLPLAWRRGCFDINMENGRATVRGQVSPPFGSYRGNAAGPQSSGRIYSLIYIPEARIVATLRTAQQVKALAAELAVVLIRGGPLPAPGAVVERHEREAK